MSYCTLLMSFFTASTISYDEFNHGFFYLFSLPVSRKGYVAEKYLFGVLTGGVTWAATTVIGGIYEQYDAGEFSAVGVDDRCGRDFCSTCHFSVPDASGPSLNSARKKEGSWSQLWRWAYSLA